MKTKMKSAVAVKEVTGVTILVECIKRITNSKSTCHPILPKRNKNERFYKEIRYFSINASLKTKTY